MLLFLIGFLTAPAQQELQFIDHDLKVGNRNLRTVFTVVDEETGNYALFLDDKKMLYGYLYDADHKQLGKFALEGLPNKYKEIIGYTIDGKKIRLFLKDGKSKAFASVLFDFDNQSSTETVYPIKLKRAYSLEGYTNGNTFYLISVFQNSSLLQSHIFCEG